MSGLSVVIPSKTASNLMSAVFKIAAYEPELRVIVVDDGLDLGGEIGMFIKSRCTIVDGKTPFCFSRNVNIGIAAADDDDVIVMNDDALLETPGGLSMMSIAAGHHPEVGIVSAACNNVGNMNQHRKQSAGMIRFEPRMVCFVCVLIPRRTIDVVGLLDERFVDYGLDDDDYCLRVRNAGLKIGIFDPCFVDHSKLKSTYRGAANAGGDFRPNLRRYIEKWGVDNRGSDRAHSQFPECFPPA